MRNLHILPWSASRTKCAWSVLLLVVSSAAAQHIACLGRIEPGERVLEVAAPPGTIVGELLVQRGDRVEAGAVMASLRAAPVYQARVELARQQLARAEASLNLVRTGERPEIIRAQEALIAAQEAEVRLLNIRMERYGALLREESIAQDDYDEIVSRQGALEAHIRREHSVLESLRSGRAEEVLAAGIDVKLAHAQIAEAEAALEMQRIRAPLTATVLEVHAWPGESVGEGGALVSLGDIGNMMVLAEVYESDVPRVKVGQRASFRGHAFAGEMGGQVKEIESVFQQSRIFPLDPAAHADRRVVRVRIQPDDPGRLTALSRAHVIVTILAP